MEPQSPNFWDIAECLDYAVARLLHSCFAGQADCGLVKVLRERPPLDASMLVFTGVIIGDIYVCFSTAGLSMTDLRSIAFYSSLVLAIISWERAITVDPGAIPDDWRMGANGRPLFELLGQDHSSGRRRYAFREGDPTKYLLCPREQKFKPKRAHFCRQLRRNVLRMDHYCNWLANCIGYHNQKYFYLFLLYAGLATTINCTVAVKALIHIKSQNAVRTAFLLPGALLSSCLASAIWPFLGWHTCLICRNTSCVEFAQRGWAPSPYDEGICRNIQSVMGECFLCWPLPFSGPPGTGLEWGVAEADVPISTADFLGLRDKARRNGVPGSSNDGPVDSPAGVEVMLEVGAEKLQNTFKRKHTNFRTQWSFPEDFPSAAVMDAFRVPEVDRTLEPFSWADVDLQRVTAQLVRVADLSEEKVMERLEPALRRYQDTLRQPRITEYLLPAAGDVAVVRSSRMQQALRGLRGESPDMDAEERGRGRGRRRGQARRGRGRGRRAQKAEAPAAFASLRGAASIELDSDEDA
ncbi:unnamed protein product [Effrenium voratum]|nr:unnamed protein product [Effrenium voratum]